MQFDQKHSNPSWRICSIYLFQYTTPYMFVYICVYIRVRSGEPSEPHIFVAAYMRLLQDALCVLMRIVKRAKDPLLMLSIIFQIYSSLLI